MDLGIVHVVILIAIILPALHVLVSRRVRGAGKLAWLIAVVFMSWMAYTIFLAATYGDREASSGDESTA